MEVDGALAWPFPACGPVIKFVSAHLNGAENRPRKYGNPGISVKIGAEEVRKKMIKTVSETAVIVRGGHRPLTWRCPLVTKLCRYSDPVQKPEL